MHFIYVAVLAHTDVATTYYILHGCGCVGVGVASYPVLILFPFRTRNGNRDCVRGWCGYVHMWVCICVCGQGQMPACITLFSMGHALLPPQVGVFLVTLSFSLLPSYNQYRWDYLDLNKHRSVCIVCVRGCGCSLIPSPYFHSELGIEIGTAY